jgi:hypothetical protein
MRKKHAPHIFTFNRSYFSRDKITGINHPEFRPSPQDWEFSLNDGAAGNSTWTERAIPAENTNGIGSLSFRRYRRLSLKEGTEYEAVIYFQLLDCQPFRFFNVSIPVTGKPDRVLDFKNTERNILEVLSGDPDGYILLVVSMNPSPDWSNLNPDHIWTRENHEKLWIQLEGTSFLWFAGLPRGGCAKPQTIRAIRREGLTSWTLSL